MNRPNLFVHVSRREGYETYVNFIPRTEAIGQRIYSMLLGLSAEGKLDAEKACIVVCVDDSGNTNVIVTLANDYNDPDTSINLMVRECALKLSLISYRSEAPEHHDGLRQLTRQARAQDN